MIDNLIKGSSCRVTCAGEFGTGFLVACGRLLTARHCILPAIDGGAKIELRFSLETGDVTVTAAILDHREDFDACILTFDQSFESAILPLSEALPREGSDWRSFGYPSGKFEAGHRITGQVDQVLPAPKARIDLDVTVNPDSAIPNYRGFSGGAAVVDGVVVAMLRYRFGGSLGAISIRALAAFLTTHDLLAKGEAPKTQPRPLADRAAFKGPFEELLKRNRGAYVFLEGGHGLGKTTFCSSYTPSAPELLLVGAYCVFQPGASLSAVYRAQPDVFFDWLLTTAADLITGKGARQEKRGYGQLVREAANLLRFISDHAGKEGRQAIILVDGLNEAHDAGAALLANLMGLLPVTLPPNITVVLTAPNYSVIAPHLGGRVKAENVLALPPLSHSSSMSYCQRQLAPERRSADLINRICDKAVGHPLYLHYIIEYANNQPADDELTEFPVLTGPIEDYYRTIWEKLALNADATHMLALMARLRWGIEITLLVKVLGDAERAALTTTIRQVRHLLMEETSTTIYHQSFAAFVIEQTAVVNEVAQDRLASLCRADADARYCRLNLIYHLCRGSKDKQTEAIAACDQDWVDTGVALAAEPDQLLADVDRVRALVMERGPAVECIRVILLIQRVQFRYNVLFTQSADLMAEALIALHRPAEALAYLVRFKSLIVGPEETLQLAHRMIARGFRREAFRLLRRLQRRIREGYHERMQIQQFLHLCSLDIQTVFLARLAGGPEPTKAAVHIAEMAEQACAETLKAEPEAITEMMAPIRSLSNSYFLTFRDRYPTIAEAKVILKDEPLPPALLTLWSHALFQFEAWSDRYTLGRRRESLAQKFRDFEELLKLGQPLEPRLIPLVLDSFVRFGAPAALVRLLADRIEKPADRPIQLLAAHGVDVDFDRLSDDMNRLRTLAFLEKTELPEPGNFDADSWLPSLETLTRTLFLCDGRARRAKADEDTAALNASFAELEENVLVLLIPTLAQRVKWENSYAVPEQVLPYLHRQTLELLVDCFPQELEAHLERLATRAEDQWGLYTEGFRQAAHATFLELSREKLTPAATTLGVRLLSSWREHVIRGVENRRELVPEILRMIPLHVTFGATEEAERLYRHMLTVSMGPTWYKEEQLGLMTETLRHLPVDDDVGFALPQIAGYLDRAAGEMTFQRYVRAEKSSLAGELIRRNRFRGGVAYFRRQSCGSTAELMAESRSGFIDKPTPTKGARFPGGALEEQESILRLVRDARSVNWRIRWALLETYLCGDSRHVGGYAGQFGLLVNEAAQSGEIADAVRRAEVALRAETAPELQEEFRRSFKGTLEAGLLPHFAHLFPSAGLTTTAAEDEEPESPPESPPPQKKRDDDDEDDENDGLFMPGTFGRRSVFQDVASRLSDATAAMKLGNRKAAKEHAVTVLQSVQAAGWDIWTENLSDEHRAAEALLREGETDAMAVMRYYAPLVKEEKNKPSWVIAQHLISRIADVLPSPERSELIRVVIEHTRLMVGSAEEEIKGHEYLAEGPPSDAGDRELAGLLFWLLDHPVEVRRQRAAAMIDWLSDAIGELPALMAAIAFSNQAGYAGDALAAVLDRLSRVDPLAAWDRLLPGLDLKRFLGGSTHVSRLAILLRIGERAGSLGSDSAKAAVAEIRDAFAARPAMPTPAEQPATLPGWAECITPLWRALGDFGLAAPKVLAEFAKEVSRLSAPFDVRDVWLLEGAVSDGFRENRDGELNRWEGRLHTALNLALYRFAGADRWPAIEAALRVCNPSFPDRLLHPGENAVLARLLAAMPKRDFRGVFRDSEHCLLHLRSLFIARDETVRTVETLAVMVPGHLRQRGFFPPKLTSVFRSSDLPETASAGGPQETCSRLRPEHAFFGPFTPAAPLPDFVRLTGADQDAFVRQTWRHGRRHQLRRFGLPAQEGCTLLMKSAAVKLPPGKKLAWMIWLDGQLAGMVDEGNNQLL